MRVQAMTTPIRIPWILGGYRTRGTVSIRILYREAPSFRLTSRNQE
jgi:hypothetical protein